MSRQRGVSLSPNRDDRSYIITGGLGGFGLALAVWLAKHGARHFVLTSKRGLRTGHQNMIINGLRDAGAKVRVLQEQLPAYLTVSNAVHTGVHVKVDYSTS